MYIYICIYICIYIYIYLYVKKLLMYPEYTGSEAALQRCS